MKGKSRSCWSWRDCSLSHVVSMRLYTSAPPLIIFCSCFSPPLHSTLPRAQDKVANFWCTVSPLIKFKYFRKAYNWDSGERHTDTLDTVCNMLKIRSLTSVRYMYEYFKLMTLYRQIYGNQFMNLCMRNLPSKK